MPSSRTSSSIDRDKCHASYLPLQESSRVVKFTNVCISFGFAHLQAIILGCTELPLVLTPESAPACDSRICVVNPTKVLCFQ